MDEYLGDKLPENVSKYLKPAGFLRKLLRLLQAESPYEAFAKEILAMEKETDRLLKKPVAKLLELRLVEIDKELEKDLVVNQSLLQDRSLTEWMLIDLRFHESNPEPHRNWPGYGYNLNDPRGKRNGNTISRPYFNSTLGALSDPLWIGSRDHRCLVLKKHVDAVVRALEESNLPHKENLRNLVLQHLQALTCLTGTYTNLNFSGKEEILEDLHYLRSGEIRISWHVERTDTGHAALWQYDAEYRKIANAIRCGRSGEDVKLISEIHKSKGIMNLLKSEHSHLQFHDTEDNNKLLTPQPNVDAVEEKGKHMLILLQDWLGIYSLSKLYNSHDSAELPGYSYNENLPRNSATPIYPAGSEVVFHQLNYPGDVPQEVIQRDITNYIPDAHPSGSVRQGAERRRT